MTEADKLGNNALQALKIAFTYMPRAIEVNKFDHGENYQNILQHIEQVREILLLNDTDPDEVYDEIDPDSSPNSSYWICTVTSQNHTIGAADA